MIVNPYPHAFTTLFDHRPCLKNIEDKFNQTELKDSSKAKAVARSVLKNWGVEGQKHFKRAIVSFGICALTSTVALIAGVYASTILSAAIIAGMAGVIALGTFAGSFYSYHKAFDFKYNYTKQRILDAKAYLTLAPIEAIKRKITLMNFPDGKIDFNELVKEVDLANAAAFPPEELTKLNQMNDPLKVFLACFKRQQEYFDQCKANPSVIRNARLLPRVIISWFRNTPDANVQRYSNLVTPLVTGI